MIAGLIAFAAAAAFFGAAFYINFAEHPARLGLEDVALLTQWKPSYAAGFTMQASLAIVSFLAGTLAAWQLSDWRWLVGALVIIANWPFTLLVIMPTNHRLGAVPNEQANADTRTLLVHWGHLHAVRTVLGAIATAAFLGVLALPA